MCQALAFVSIVAFRLKKQTQLIYMRISSGENRLDKKKRYRQLKRMEREKGENNKSGQIKPVDVRDLKAVYFEIDET